MASPLILGAVACVVCLAVILAIVVARRVRDRRRHSGLVAPGPSGSVSDSANKGASRGSVSIHHGENRKKAWASDRTGSVAIQVESVDSLQPNLTRTRGHHDGVVESMGSARSETRSSESKGMSILNSEPADHRITGSLKEASPRTVQHTSVALDAARRSHKHPEQHSPRQKPVVMGGSNRPRAQAVLPLAPSVTVTTRSSDRPGHSRSSPSRGGSESTASGLRLGVKDWARGGVRLATLAEGLSDRQHRPSESPRVLVARSHVRQRDGRGGACQDAVDEGVEEVFLLDDLEAGRRPSLRHSQEPARGSTEGGWVQVLQVVSLSEVARPCASGHGVSTPSHE